MKKTLLLLMILSAIVLSLASCSLFQKWCKHKYEDTVVDPTCAAQGYTNHVCKKCGYSYQDTATQKFAHLYKSVVTSPTCLEDGYTTHTCTECGDTYTDTITRKLPHSYESETFPATCSSEGYTKYTCYYCSHTYNDDVTAITSHRFNDTPCEYCDMEEITENITLDTEWYSVDSIVFTIKTAEQLAGLASLVNDGVVTSDQIFYLDADIDLGFYEWIPIGTAEHPFSATFKGEGYTISSLKISADHDYVGLFGNVTGKVDNLNVMNASIYVAQEHSYVGILAGAANNSISSVEVSGFIDAKLSSYVGGIVGSAAPASAIYSKLTNNAVIIGQNHVGGIIGYLNTSESIQTDMLVSNGSVSGITNIGGIFGSAYAKVGSVLYHASVRAEITGDYYVGGLIGKTTNVTIDSCTNEGSTVIANSYLIENDSFYVYLGGYVGYGYIVTNCTNTVDISYNSRGSYIGGIAGYLTNTISKCENTASISGKDCVGGLVGKLETSAAITVSELKNSGNVNGNACVGGVIGYFVVNSKVNITLSRLENSGAINVTGNDAAGIVGCYNHLGNYEHTLTAADLNNTGDVIAEYHTVGGLFGYVGAANGSSIIKNSTSSANVRGNYHVGGLIGNTNIAISNCSNEGSTVTATGWYTEGSTDYVRLGGYVGIGYKVTGCTNNSDITYTGTGNYVGGIIGYATGEIQNCTNTGNITSASSHVGGIAGFATSEIQDCINTGDISSTGAHVGGIVGYVTSSVALTFKNLENTGNISGAQRVGGIIGDLIQETSARGDTWGADKPTSGSAKYHYYKTESIILNASNSGNVTASDQWGYAGGIIGLTQLNSTHKSYFSNCHNIYFDCPVIGCFTLSANHLTNTGMVSALINAGEIIGYHVSDGEEGGVNSSISSYTITGQVTLNGEILKGSYDTGYTTNNLTLSGRELYVPEVEETPEEAPEDGAETTPEGDSNENNTNNPDGEVTE